VSIDRAATLRNAEQLLRQGQLDAAIAEYVQVVEAFPRDWTTANTLGDVYVRAKQINKAIEEFVRIADGLSHEGFVPRAAALYKKALRLMPEFEPLLWRAAEAAAKQGLLVDARGYLTTIERQRREAGDNAGAAAARIRMGTLDPANYAARKAAAAERAGIGDTAGAAQDLAVMAKELQDLERQPEAIDALREAARLAPGDQALRARLFDALVASGQTEQAREFASAEQLQQLSGEPEESPHAAQVHEPQRESQPLAPATDGSDRVSLIATEIQRGHGDDAAAHALELLQSDASVRSQILVAALNAVAGGLSEPAFRTARLVADSYLVDGDWATAADAMAAFAEHAPDHVAARERLVEICEDGMLEDRLIDALARLADGYLNAGLGAQARSTAEELVARAPWDQANVSRFRQALVLLQEPDPDAIIAERLGGASPFQSTALGPASDAPSAAAATALPPEQAEDPAPDLEDVFIQFRGEVSRKTIQEAADADYQHAIALKDAGDLDGCIEALLQASKAPSLRFAAGSLLARVYKQRGQFSEALEWFERAAQAPAPSAAEYHEVLFELTEGLEASGDVTRALAVGLELQAEAGAYRDVAERVERLAKAQARG
jgi:tetratricopeptide (TPR) repeat protein